jgi:zinc transport system substrate-binding protein
MYRVTVTAAIFGLLGQVAYAEDMIVTDSPVIQSFVARATGATPDVLMQAGADPHHFALRPSQMRTLQKADWLVWVGPEFSTWLEGPAAQLEGTAQILRLAGDDAHAWLDTVTASEWTARIATALGAPVEAGIWDGLTEELQSSLAPLSDIGLLSGHDAYAAFGQRFGLNFVGSISDSHAHDPGPAHLAELRAMLAEGKVGCVVSDSHEIEAYVDLVVEGTDIPVVEIDLTGHGLEPGPEFYPNLMRNVAAALKGCVN